MRRKTFTTGQPIEFQPETWESWRAGVYVSKVGDMRGHHRVKIPGQTKTLDLSVYDLGVKTVPAEWIVPTRRVRAVTEENA